MALMQLTKTGFHEGPITAAPATRLNAQASQPKTSCGLQVDRGQAPLTPNITALCLGREWLSPKLRSQQPRSTEAAAP